MSEPTTPMDTAGLTWTLDGGVVARPFEDGDAAEMYDLVQRNREHLDQWLFWSNTVQVESDAAATITRYAARRAKGTGFNCGLWVDDQLAGSIVCRDLEWSDRQAEIGYWLGKDFTGRGLATAAARRATDYLIGERGVHRAFMQCRVDNLRSRAIPERLGYRLEGILRESHRIHSRYHDVAVYAILDREWRNAE